MSAAYLKALYHADILENPILIGRVSPELDEYLEKENASCWAFITAYNPMSVVLSPEENKSRNKDLESKIKEYRYLHGEGRDPSGKWIPERSFLILNISRKDARELAMEFEQKAIVYGERGNVAELIIL